MIADILARILEWKRQEVVLSRRQVALDELRLQARDLPPSRSFWQALQPTAQAGTRIIAEIKKASPSAGLIREDFDPVAIATTYAQHGAAAISVLTDRKFFQGELAFLGQVRQHVDVPLLRKDFVVDPYQLYEARVHGADAALLIAAALDVPILSELTALSFELGLEPLVEVHTAAELEKALECSCRLIGINNRDLHIFHTDVATTLELLPHVPEDYMVVSESGLRDRETIVRLESHGAGAFLIGESLMREPDFGPKLDQLRGVVK
ncbi:indole-3-glycerol phosphate synthase TrpC [Candidatus Entotheonella serta]|nr:indole-3-glycerol phosphate synthase TrpC [Candidatus Entotheonella serta]